jgi:ribosomal protein S18 acetylase RimI-like enzyme
MELFAARTQTSQAGLYGMLVQPEFRGQGLGKYLVCLALQHLQEQMYGQVEAVVLADQVDGRSLLDRVGFTQIDEGWSYTKQLRP